MLNEAMCDAMHSWNGNGKNMYFMWVENCEFRCDVRVVEEEEEENPKLVLCWGVKEGQK